VTAPRTPQSEPASHGEIVLKDMAFVVPSGFTGKGTYKLINADAMDHEGSIMRLNPGAQLKDLIAYFGVGHRQGPPPGDSFGGFGALGPGAHGWMNLDLPPGSYALVCRIPGPDGMPHVAMGMAHLFSV
jgi:hypothetical protein